MIKLVETLRDVNCDRCDEKILNMRCDATRTLDHAASYIALTP